jgi:hypothetical protein
LFITNHLTPGEMLSELLSIKGYTKHDTERFKSLRHNNDLCPMFSDHADAMLNAYIRHRTDVHDIQGPRDEGVDVMLRYQDGGPHCLGLQIKSYNEIVKWMKGQDKNFILTLKSQYTSAMQNIKVEDYYLLLCTDEVMHEQQIRYICSELKQFERLKIVRPRQALAFYEMSDLEVQAFVTRLLCKDDQVFQGAMNTICDMPKDQAYMTLALVCQALSGKTSFDQDDLANVYSDWLGLDSSHASKPDRIADIVSELLGAGLEATSSDDFKIDIRTLPRSLCAIYFDSSQRHSENTVQSLAVLLNVIPSRRKRHRDPGRK